MKKYQCNICGFIYEESVGDPAHGIKAGTLGRISRKVGPALIVA